MKKIFPRLALFLALAALLSSAAGSVWAARAADSISIEEYWNLLKDTRQAVADLKGKPQEAIRLGLDELAAQWQAIPSARLPGGEELPLDNSFIVSALQNENPDLNRLAEILDTLIASGESQAAARPGAANIESLNEILSRPEFQWKEEQPNPLDNWLQTLWDRFAAWLDKIFPDAQIAIDPTPIAAILLALALLYAFRGLFKDLISDARLHSEGEPGDELLTADSAFQRAQTLSRGGDYRAAVRYLYLSSLLLLDERGVLRYDRTRTNREVLRTVSDQPELAQPLSEVVEVFDNAWYGYHEVNEAQFQHYSQRVQELKEKK